MTRNRNTANGLTIIVLAALTVAGCSRSSESSSSKQNELPPIKQLSAIQKDQKRDAVAAKDKLFASLMGELMKSIGENGPAKSINICKTRAPEIAAAVSRETGVAIGRTSFRLRNAENRPPEWAASFVNDRVENEVHVALPENRLGVLLPIRLQATCLLCHGRPDQIMPEVKTAINSSYPDDQATDFVEGDLRGYFWMEVDAADTN